MYTRFLVSIVLHLYIQNHGYSLLVTYAVCIMYTQFHVSMDFVYRGTNICTAYHVYTVPRFHSSALVYRSTVIYEWVNMVPYSVVP